eukprot:5821199-Pleurochrysis_carterae.AAC.4
MDRVTHSQEGAWATCAGHDFERIAVRGDKENSPIPWRKSHVHRKQGRFLPAPPERRPRVRSSCDASLRRGTPP